MTYRTSVEALNPDGYWPLDDASGNFADASGNGFNATAYTTGGTIGYQAAGPTIDSVAQYAVNLASANSEYGSAGEGVDDAATPATGMTLSFWVKSSGNGYDPVSKANADDSWEVYINSSGEVVFYTYQTDGSTEHGAAIPSLVFINDGAWHHVVCWVDVTNVYPHVVIDGGTEATDSTVAGTWNGSSTDPLLIGRAGWGGYLNGDLAHVAYWASDVGADTRAKLYSGAFTTPQTLVPDADTDAGTWATTPLWSKVGAAGGDVITATAA